jgi:hypothetical protein
VFTFTFTTPTAGSVLGDTWGSGGSGGAFSSLSDKVISNPVNGLPALTIPAGAWGGTRQAGDVLTLVVLPAASARVLRYVGPPNAAAAQADVRLLFEVHSP